MYYGLEQPIEAPKVAIWDMQPMMQYISLLKDRYDKTQEKLDKFAEKWGDLVSPLAKDNEFIQKETMGRVLQKLNDLEASGTDPYRSSDGIGAINNLIRSINTDKLKRVKASIPIYESYMREAAKLGNKYNEDLEALRPEFQAKGKRPSEWDSAVDGTFPVYSPLSLESLTDVSQDIFRNLAPQQRIRGGADTDYDRKRLGKDAQFYDIIGVAEDVANNAAEGTKKALDNTILGQFYRLQAQKKAQNIINMSNGVIPQENLPRLTETIYTQDIFKANAGHLQPKDQLNEFAKMRAQSNERIRVHRENARLSDQLARQREIDKLKITNPEYFDENGKLKNPEDRITDSDTGQSYVRAVYNTSIGKIFNIDMYRASDIIAKGKAGKYIWERQRNIMRRYKTNKNGNKSVPEYNYDKIIKAHTIQGNAASNMIMMGVDGRAGQTTGTGNNRMTHAKTQFKYEERLDGKKLVTNKSLISNAAGYGGKVESNNHKLGKDSWLTTTDNIIGILGKNGVYSLWCEVLDDNGNSYYYKMGINSMAKRGGQYMSTTGTREQPLGLNEFEAASRQQRDALATKLYTKAGSENNDAAFASDYETGGRQQFDLYDSPWTLDTDTSEE